MDASHFGVKACQAHSTRSFFSPYRLAMYTSIIINTDWAMDTCHFRMRQCIEQAAGWRMRSMARRRRNAAGCARWLGHRQFASNYRGCPEQINATTPCGRTGS